MYYEGKGVSQDYKTAFDLFGQAAEQGIASAQFAQTADKADAEAQFKLGLMYDHGFNVEQDYDAAIKWYRRAASHGHAKAQIKLGSIYSEGRGVAKDYQTAINWYRQAAHRGIAAAQYNLGSVYETLDDYIHAHVWWNIAASKGHKDAVSKLDFIEKKMSAEDVNKSQKRARICLAKDYKNCD